MARRNLKINYGTIQCVANEATKLSDSINSIKNSLNSMNGIIQSCDGDAANALKEKQPDIIKNLDKLQRGLMGMSKIFNNYVESMCGIISYGSGGIDSIVHVSTDDVRWNLRQLIDLVESFENFANGVQPSVSATNSFSLELSESDKMAVMQCNNRLNEVKDLMKITSSYIVVHEDDFEKFRKVILDYENMDDEFKNQIKDFYYDFADIKWYQTTAFKALAGVVLVTGSILIIAFFAPESAIALVLINAAENAVAIGIINTILEGTTAFISGDDIEDAVATGLFEGSIEGFIIGGAEKIATLSIDTKYVSKILENTNFSRDNLEFGFKMGGEYLGRITNDVVKNIYNDEEVNLQEIVGKEFKNMSWKILDKKLGGSITSKINNTEVGDGLGKILNKVNEKAGKYTFEASFYVGRIFLEGEYEELKKQIETGQFELTDMTDYISSKFDYVKLGNAMFKDDAKDNFKKLARSLGNSLRNSIKKHYK